MRSGQDVYLVETKWTKAKATIDDVDSLFRRLGDTPPAVIGILVSVNGFTNTAVKRVEAQRSRPLLLVNGDELAELWYDSGELRRLLARKQRHLLVQARMVFGVETRAPQPSGLIASPTFFAWPDGRCTASLVCGGDFDQFVFALDMPDIDWAYGGSGGVELDVRLDVTGEESLIALLAALGEIGFVSEQGRWSIQQASANWHGFGAAELALALRGWAERYETIDAVHHTEQVVYQDVCEGGIWVLSADISAGAPRAVLHSQFSLQLEGQPVLGSMLDDLLEVLRAEPPLFMRPRLEPSVTRARFTRELLPKLEVCAYVAEQPELSAKDEDWVRGLVITNPFTGRSKAQAQGMPEWWPPQLADSEVLICALRNWHPLAEPRQQYHLERAEWVETAEALVVHLVANW